MYFSVSVTTRAPRPGEVNGRDYWFVTPAEFDRLVSRGELLEWAEIHGGLHRSGTPRAPVEQALGEGRPVLVEVDLQGARAIKKAMPEACMVFLAPPSFDELARRLRDRGTESSAAFERRLQTAREEIAARDEFDVTVVNDDLPDVVDRLVDLLVGPDVTCPASREPTRRPGGANYGGARPEVQRRRSDGPDRTSPHATDTPGVDHAVPSPRSSVP